MSEYAMLEHEMKEIKRNQEFIIKLLSPKEYTVSILAQMTGKTRQAVRDWLLSNAEPDVGFFKKNGKIIVSEEVALHYINERR